MTRGIRAFSSALRLLLWSTLLLAISPAVGQVAPAEILNPKLKADEQQYLPQLQALHRSIAAEKFPYPFVLTRYLDAGSGRRAALDSNGIEFIYFRRRVVLKISGFYKAAFNSTQLSQNERASRVLEDVVAPVLRLVVEQFPRTVDCDGIGFEIVYGTRDANNAYDYEGREALVVVLSRDDAFAYVNAARDAERQQLLNRSDIFVDGEDFGLALGQHDPFNVRALERSVPRQAESRSSASDSALAPDAASTAASAAASADTAAMSSSAASASGLSPAVSGAAVSPVASASPVRGASTSATAATDAVRMQTQFQPQLNAIVKEDGARLHLAEGAGPSFGVNDDRIVLHFTMQNTLVFERGTTSIYKRAAQSFDLFLAPELRALLGEIPGGAQYEELMFSVLNRFGPGDGPPETIDYICPANSVRSFAENRITSQDLINQSVVLVNGVRIALNLQLAE